MRTRARVHTHTQTYATPLLITTDATAWAIETTVYDTVVRWRVNFA